MNLQQISARVSQSLGRDHLVVRTLRPLYENLLDVATGGRGFQRTINGVEPFFIDPHHRDLFPETWEPETYEFLRTRVKPGATCIDVGAHVGIYALSLARWSGATGRVFAFEPNPGSRRILESNVRRNRLQERITVVPQGVSDHASEAQFFAAEGAAFSRFGEPNPERPEGHQAMTVSLTTLDEFCSARDIRPEWILLDIEGFEVAALRGARRIIDAGRGYLGIVVEMHPFLWECTGTSRAEFEQLLNELRLNPRALSGQRDLWAENGQVVMDWAPTK